MPWLLARVATSTPAWSRASRASAGARKTNSLSGAGFPPSVIAVSRLTMVRSAAESCSEMGSRAVEGSSRRGRSMPSNITSPPKATVKGVFSSSASSSESFSSLVSSGATAPSSTSLWFSASGEEHEVRSASASATEPARGVAGVRGGGDREECIRAPEVWGDGGVALFGTHATGLRLAVLTAWSPCGVILLLNVWFFWWIEQAVEGRCSSWWASLPSGSRCLSGLSASRFLQELHKGCKAHFGVFLQIDEAV